MKRIAPTLLTSLALLLLVPAIALAQDHESQQAENEALVVNFYNRFFNDHDVREAAQVVAEDYRQHNPHVPDGKAPFVDYFAGFFKDHPNSKARIVRSAAKDDLVWLHVHSREDAEDRGEAVVDIFRVLDGQIVEHWDVIQPVPEKSANDNTMF